MNLAIQKRNEQLERWRQNEAQIEFENAVNDSVPSYRRSMNSSENALGNDSDQCISPTVEELEEKNFKYCNEPFGDDSARYFGNKSQLPCNNISDTDSDDEDPDNTRNGFYRDRGFLTYRFNFKSMMEKEHLKSVSPKLKSSQKSNVKRIDCDVRVRFSASTLFAAACSNGDIEECSRLLENDLVDIDSATHDGLTGLHEAVIAGNFTMVEYLLGKGANINCCDNEGWTPLHAAASLNQLDIVKYLLEQGADSTIVNCENLLAIDLARNEQVKNVLKTYLKGYDIDSLRGQEEQLINADIDKWIETGHFDGRSHPMTKATVLHVIAAKGYVNLMSRILSSRILRNQIDIDARDSEGFTPLLAASFWSQDKIVQLLIEHGADISAKANDGYSISSSQLQSYQQLKSQEPKPSPRTTSVSSSTAPQSGYYSTSPSPVCTDKKQLGRQNSNSSIDSYKSQQQVSAAPRPTNSYAPKIVRPTSNHLFKSQSLDISKSQKAESDAVNGKSVSMSLDGLLSISDSLSDAEVRKRYKELLIDHEKLKSECSETEAHWATTERQLQRKISELEEENKLIEDLKHEISRLKEENSSLIRVVSKLSKH